jgi:hypothetical protein
MHKTDKHLTPEQIAQCADAINSGTYAHLPQAMRHHLQECHTCASEVVSVTEMASGENHELDKILREGSKNVRGAQTISLWRKHKRLLSGLAASIVLIAAALILVNKPFEQNGKESLAEQNLPDEDVRIKQIPDDQSGDTTADTQETAEDSNPQEAPSDKKIEATPVIQTENQMIARYEPDPKLEKLYDNMQGTYRGGSVHVESPRELHPAKDAILSWDNPGGQLFIVEIFDNTGNEILSRETNTDTLALPDLSAGLYYWKLIDEDFELQFVGKIIVEE